MTHATSARIQDALLIGTILERVAQSLEAIMGCDLVRSGLTVGRERTRPAGKATIHISFKLGLCQDGGRTLHGALLLPLPEAITMACFLLMMPEDAVLSRRHELSLDPSLKQAMLEIGNLIGSASTTAMAYLGAAGWSVSSEGCQGVRPGVRPAFPYEEGDELVVGRVTARLVPFPPFELILMVPPLG
jgi:hypothetical protein